MKLAILLERVPILPDLPCELAAASWPVQCPDGHPVKERCAFLLSSPSHLHWFFLGMANLNNRW